MVLVVCPLAAPFIASMPLTMLPELSATKEPPKAMAPPLASKPRIPNAYVPHNVKLTGVGQTNMDKPVTVTRKVAVAVCAVGFVESVTFSVNWKVPVAVGVPEVSVRPAGRLEPVARVQV